MWARPRAFVSVHLPGRIIESQGGIARTPIDRLDDGAAEDMKRNKKNDLLRHLTAVVRDLGT